jgi:hypothetical protein
MISSRTRKNTPHPGWYPRATSYYLVGLLHYGNALYLNPSMLFGGGGLQLNKVSEARSIRETAIHNEHHWITYRECSAAATPRQVLLDRPQLCRRYLTYAVAGRAQSFCARWAASQCSGCCCSNSGIA